MLEHNIHSYQATLLTYIHSSDYKGTLPPVSREGMLKILRYTMERHRKEWSGDAILGTLVAEYVCQMYPDGIPSFFTQVRSTVVSNVVLGSLICKAGGPIQSETRKWGGDALEAMLGAYYDEKGFEAVHEWGKKSIVPLIRVVGREAWKDLIGSVLKVPKENAGLWAIWDLHYQDVSAAQKRKFDDSLDEDERLAKAQKMDTDSSSDNFSKADPTCRSNRDLPFEEMEPGELVEATPSLSHSVTLDMLEGNGKYAAQERSKVDDQTTKHSDVSLAPFLPPSLLFRSFAPVQLPIVELSAESTSSIIPEIVYSLNNLPSSRDNVSGGHFNLLPKTQPSTAYLDDATKKRVVLPSDRFPRKPQVQENTGRRARLALPFSAMSKLSSPKSLKENAALVPTTYSQSVSQSHTPPTVLQESFLPHNSTPSLHTPRNRPLSPVKTKTMVIPPNESRVPLASIANVTTSSKDPSSLRAATPSFKFAGFSNQGWTRIR